MENTGKVASVFNPNLEKEQKGKSLEQIINNIVPPDFSNFNPVAAATRNTDTTYRPEIPKVTLPDFKDLIPTFKF